MLFLLYTIVCPGLLLNGIRDGMCQKKGNMKVKFPLSTLRRRIGGVEIWLHSFLTSFLYGNPRSPFALNFEKKTPKEVMYFIVFKISFLNKFKTIHQVPGGGGRGVEHPRTYGAEAKERDYTYTGLQGLHGLF